jgi:DNA-binding transcriptional LysR family regulator
MDALTGIRVFCTVAEFKSFVAAADRLNLSPAMVSKHVMRLEDRLGSRLLNRSTRRVSLTEIGSTYYSQAKQILEGLDEVEAVVSNVTVVPRGSLRVSAPMWVASRAFASFLAEYHAQYPQVCFDFDLTGRVVNLVEEGFDLALRTTAQPERLDPGLIARQLIDVVFHLVAAPAYLEQAGRPARLADLNGHSFLMLNGVKPRSAFKFEGPSGAELVKFNNVMESNNESLLHQAALAGLGMTFLPRLMVEADLREGALENVLPESARVRAQLYAVYPSRKYLSAKVRTFIDLLVRRVEIDVRGERQALVTAQGR